LGQFYTQYDQMGVTEFAFSPDSRRLAYFHNHNSLGFGYLSVVDLSSQLSRLLIKVGDLKSLVWSPDGRSLAMIVRFDPASYMEDVIVVDAGTGQITYSAPIDYQSNAVKDWPMEEWGVEFPVEMGDLQSCSSPPGKVGSE
jgi:dipeptidyl aminopeptidase/acylaminoacyl peptidase